MRRTTYWMSGSLLAALGLTLGLSCSQEAPKAPLQSSVEVTYYYLPG
jgi:hypothetical protein